MMTERERAQRRVNKLLERANHRSTPTAEASSCRQVAARLMDKHGISEQQQPPRPQPATNVYYYPATTVVFSTPVTVPSGGSITFTWTMTT